MFWRQHLLLDCDEKMRELRLIEPKIFDRWQGQRHLRRHRPHTFTSNERWIRFQDEILGDLSNGIGIVIWHMPTLKPRVKARFDKLKSMPNSDSYLMLEFETEKDHWVGDMFAGLLEFAPGAKPRVFVSHAHADASNVDQAVLAPLRLAGADPWCSRHDIPLGADFTKQIETALRVCDAVVVVVSESAAGSQWVKAEVNYALSQSRFNGRVLPVILEKCAMDRIHSTLDRYNALDVNDPDRSAKLQRFVNGEE